MAVAKSDYEEYLLHVILDNYVKKNNLAFFTKRKLCKKSCCNGTCGKII